MTGRIHSLQSLGTVDGPGVRTVVFLQGCALRCRYCHNPDTWAFDGGEEITPQALVARIARFVPYIRGGGVTFSGGEPCLQAPFVGQCAALLHEMGLHVALDTAGAPLSDGVRAMLAHIDLVLLDVKATDEAAYAHCTGGGSLAQNEAFLQYLQSQHIPAWVRHVVVPNENDTPAHMQALRAHLAPYDTVQRVELLPFRNLCVEKYRALGIPFPLEGVGNLSPTRLAALQEAYLGIKMS